MYYSKDRGLIKEDFEIEVKAAPNKEVDIKASGSEADEVKAFARAMFGDNFEFFNTDFDEPEETNEIEEISDEADTDTTEFDEDKDLEECGARLTEGPIKSAVKSAAGAIGRLAHEAKMYDDIYQKFGLLIRPDDSSTKYYWATKSSQIQPSTTLGDLIYFDNFKDAKARAESIKAAGSCNVVDPVEIIKAKVKAKGADIPANGKVIKHTDGNAIPSAKYVYIQGLDPRANFKAVFPPKTQNYGSTIAIYSNGKPTRNGDYYEINKPKYEAQVSNAGLKKYKNKGTEAPNEGEVSDDSNSNTTLDNTGSGKRIEQDSEVTPQTPANGTPSSSSGSANANGDTPTVTVLQNQEPSNVNGDSPTEDKPEETAGKTNNATPITTPTVTANETPKEEEKPVGQPEQKPETADKTKEPDKDTTAKIKEKISNLQNSIKTWQSNNTKNPNGYVQRSTVLSEVQKWLKELDGILTSTSNAANTSVDSYADGFESFSRSRAGSALHEDVDDLETAVVTANDFCLTVTELPGRFREPIYHLVLWGPMDRKIFEVKEPERVLTNNNTFHNYFVKLNFGILGRSYGVRVPQRSIAATLDELKDLISSGNVPYENEEEAILYSFEVVPVN